MSFLKNLSKSADKLVSGQVGKLVEKQIDEAFGGEGKSSNEPAKEQWHSSNGGGKKRALFIGINYFGQKGELKGCINDVKNIQSFVQKQCGFPRENMRVLTDDQSDPSAVPTRSNIIAGMSWLIEDARSGDSLFFHYSGHGFHQEDNNGDEGDGRDETICPVDYQKSGMITDDEMHALMARDLPAGVRFTAIFDCCHSGSIMDLPFTYTVDGNLSIVEVDNRAAAAKKILKAGIAFAQGRKDEAVRGVIDGIKTFAIGDKSSGGAVSSEKIDDKTTKADVIQFSGCRDCQTSADAFIENESTGAMSHAFIRVIEKNNFDISFQDLLKQIREVLQQGYSQVPQLSAGRRLDMSVKFHL